MASEKPSLTVYFDGSCPLCRAEISHYRAEAGADALDFVDVSLPEVVVPADLTRQEAMSRFHVRADDGTLISGAAAFVDVWRRLPRWRWAARLAALPGMLVVLETGYRLFLPIRPVLAKLFGRALAAGPGGDREGSR